MTKGGLAVVRGEPFDGLSEGSVREDSGLLGESDTLKVDMSDRTGLSNHSSAERDTDNETALSTALRLLDSLSDSPYTGMSMFVKEFSSNKVCLCCMRLRGVRAAPRLSVRMNVQM